MVKLKHCQRLHEEGKQSAPKRPKIPYEVELEGIKCKIRSRLAPEDIKKIPSLSFHGMRAGGLEYLESGEGKFEGYAVHVDFRKFGTMETGQFLNRFFGASGNSLTDSHIEDIKICFHVAMNRSCEGFGRTGFRSLESSDFPAMLISNSAPSMNHLTIYRNEVVGITILSESEINSILKRTMKIPEGPMYWDLARLQLFRDLGMQKLAQRVINELERIT